MDWHSHHWESLVSKCEVLDVTVREGIATYAEKQGYIAKRMAHHFSSKWLPSLEGHCITPDWPTHYTSHNESIPSTIYLFFRVCSNVDLHCNSISIC